VQDPVSRWSSYLRKYHEALVGAIKDFRSDAGFASLAFRARRFGCGLSLATARARARVREKER